MDIENALNKALFFQFIEQFNNTTSGRFQGGEGFYTLQLTIHGVEELHKAKNFWRNILKSFLHFFRNNCCGSLVNFLYNILGQ